MPAAARLPEDRRTAHNRPVEDGRVHQRRNRGQTRLRPQHRRAQTPAHPRAVGRGGNAVTVPLPPPMVARGTVVPPRDGPIVAGYEVLGELGRGGMGVVYLARQLRPHRLVALKMISAGANAGARELERFRREADAVAQFQHPHIVQVYEVGEQDGHPFFALEYVGGGSLDRYLAGTPQPPHAAAQLVERLAHAIHHAHGRGIIHRDLKPGNILLASGGLTPPDSSRLPESGGLRPPLAELVPKITDFGLAKLLDAGEI